MKRTLYNKFNRGEVSPEALARDDIKMVAESASLIKNFLPKRLGPMMRRPGTQYIASLPGAAYFLPFTRAVDDQALFEFTNNQLRVWVSDSVVTRPSRATSITALASWTLDAEASAGYGAEVSGSTIEINAQTTGAAGYAWSNVALGGGDDGQEHGLRIVITKAPLKIQIGTGNALYSEDLFSGTLLPGTHSFSVTPTTNLTITASNSTAYKGILYSCAVESSGAMALTTTVGTSALTSIRMAQANDVCYCTYTSGQHFQIERRGTKSWSICDFRADDGPFRDINVTDITMTPSALSGSGVTLTASRAYFDSDMVGGLFKVASKGQLVTKAFTAASQSSNSIKVLGSGAARKFNFTRTVVGVWGGVTTLALQQSTDDATWTDYDTYITGVGTLTINDGLDNQTMYYRLYTNAWDGNPSQIDTTLNYPGGSILGTCRVTSYTSSTVVNIQVLESFGSTTASDNWWEGAWSAYRGFPTAVEMNEGRLWFAGRSEVWGSVSDAYSSFDRDVAGDSASIYRSIAFESSANIYWIAGADRMLIGMTADEPTIRSSSFNEILTPSNAVIRPGTGWGAAPVDCEKVDNAVYFVQRGLRKIIRLDYNSTNDGYEAADLMKMHEDICKGRTTDGIKRIAVTRIPETRVWAVMNNGEVRVLLIDPLEEVSGWSRFVIGESAETGTDTITDVVTMPGLGEDRIYFVVKRGTTYYLEKLAKLEEAVGDTTSYHTDAAIWVAGPTTTPACAHIADGSTVRVWSADNAGKDLGEFTVATGAITLPSESTLGVVIGIAFDADYTSNKIAGFADYSTQSEWIRMTDVGLIARNIVPSGITHGPSFSLLEALPEIESGTTYTTTYKVEDWDVPPMEFNGTKSVKERFYLRAKTPITIMGLTYGVQEARNKGG